MQRHIFATMARFSLLLAVMLLTASYGFAKPRTDAPGQAKKITQAEREAAADRAAAAGLALPTLGTAMMAMPGTAPHYYSVANYANSPLPVVDPVTGAISGGIRKFVNTLPGLGEGNANNLGQYIPVAVADTTSYPGSDYYVIAVVQYQEQMHSDLPPTTLRGYVQLDTSVIPGAGVTLTNPDGSPILLPNGSPALAVDKPITLDH